MCFRSKFVAVSAEHVRLTTAPLPSVISIPLPTPRLALAALQALQVDEELSPLVRRSFTVEEPLIVAAESTPGKTVLRTDYKAATNRMLRVAVNGFMESLGLVLGTMEELDVDVLDGVSIEQES